MKLVVQSIKNDLTSRSPVHVNLALHCIANIGSREMADAFGKDIPKLLTSGYWGKKWLERFCCNIYCIVMLFFAAILLTTWSRALHCVCCDSFELLPMRCRWANGPVASFIYWTIITWFVVAIYWLLVVVSDLYLQLANYLFFSNQIPAFTRLARLSHFYQLLN